MEETSMKKIILFLIFSLFWDVGAMSHSGVSSLNAQQQGPTLTELRDSFSVGISGRHLVIGLRPQAPMQGQGTLMNIVGQVVDEWLIDWETGLEKSKKVMMRAHPPGIYIFTLKVNGQILSRRVII
jgi:Na+-translocating ferredoxin:NAD+ oxidoreductase RnfE subunit